MKNMNTMTLLAAGTCAMIAASAANAALVAGWDFQTSPGTAVAASSNPSTWVANFGSGNLYTGGLFGSTSTAPAVTGLTGTNLNTSGTSLSTTTSTPAAIGLINSNNLAARSIVFKVSMTGYSDLAISYAGARSSSASGYGFRTMDWSWGVGTSTAAPASYTSASSSLVIADTVGNGTYGAFTVLGDTTGLNVSEFVYVKLTLSGATNTSGGSFRLDNVQFNATAVPAPGALALLGVAGLIGARRRR